MIGHRAAGSRQVGSDARASRSRRCWDAGLPRPAREDRQGLAARPQAAAPTGLLAPPEAVSRRDPDRRAAWARPPRPRRSPCPACTDAAGLLPRHTIDKRPSPDRCRVETTGIEGDRQVDSVARRAGRPGRPRLRRRGRRAVGRRPRARPAAGVLRRQPAHPGPRRLRARIGERWRIGRCCWRCGCRAHRARTSRCGSARTGSTCASTRAARSGRCSRSSSRARSRPGTRSRSWSGPTTTSRSPTSRRARTPYACRRCSTRERPCRRRCAPRPGGW